jgi:hypothetical protein
MAHPQCCKHPETCTLSYREHLLGVVLGASAIPSRAIHRTPGQVDEPAWRTEARERRWARDMPAFKSLVDQGYDPPHIDGSADLANRATSVEQINAGRL